MRGFLIKWKTLEVNLFQFDSIARDGSYNECNFMHTATSCDFIKISLNEIFWADVLLFEKPFIARFGRNNKYFLYELIAIGEVISITFIVQFSYFSYN